MAQIIIEICPHEPRTSLCLIDGSEVSSDPEIAKHVADCNRSGDCNTSGEYENRLATPEEKAATCHAIYFDSDSDFSDETTADTYLVWEAASHEE